MPDDSRRCATCGGELVEGRCARCANQAVSKIVRLDAARLLLLASTCVLCFLGTRAVAKMDRDSDTRQAAASYSKGMEAQRAGDRAAAIQDFRDASIHDRDNATYSLALAGALSAGGQDDEALQLLLRIREDSPENPEINSQIAREEAKRHDLAQAEHYYQHALYGIWQGDDAAERRREIRLEFVRFLAAHDRRNAALSELLALQSEAPKDPAVITQIAGLELDLGEAKTAQSEYEQALRVDKRDMNALSGLAKADFRLGRFAAARRDLSTVEAQTAALPADLAQLKDELQWIDDHDPGKHGLSRDERIARMNQALSQALEHVRSCEAAKPSANSLNNLRQAESDLVSFQNGFNGDLTASLQDSLQDGFDVMMRGEEVASAQCAGKSADDALLALARAKGAGNR